jgi:glutamyl-tRNA(Gln) amidotransferase subunit E
MDDTPPFLMNDQALDIAIQVGQLMDCNIVDELHIARKQYLDGSIPTGFQRTAIVSVNGKIPYKNREINIIQMSIEEDSCREISDYGHRRVYKTDRLGMPLIETVTAPEMLTPQEVADVNQIIRKVARSTGKVRTGIGAGREDVNVSVTGGTRIEIKGVAHIKSIPLLTYNEAMRQWNLLRLREELAKRGITTETFHSKIDDVTKLLKKTQYEPISNAISKGMLVKCVTLTGFKGLLSWKTQTDTFFGKEISDRVRVIACLSNTPNIIHSDSAENTISSADGQKIRKSIGATEDDTLVLVWGDEMDTETASREIIIRAKEATIGIPSETRQAFRDGTNGFERILPGADRMYPDTDLPPIMITAERLSRLKSEILAPFWIRLKEYKDLNISDDIAEPLSISKYATVFEYAVKQLKLNPILVAHSLIQFPKRLKKKKLKTDLLSISNLEQLFKAVADGTLNKDGILFAMEMILKNDGKFDEKITLPATDNDIQKSFEKCLNKLNSEKFFNNDKKPEYLIGLIMADLIGKCNGQTVRKYVSNNFKMEA